MGEKEMKTETKNGMLRIRLICMRCGWQKMGRIDPKNDGTERICPRCGSNSIRVSKKVK